MYVIESEWNDVTPAKRVELTCNTPDEALPVYWKKGTELKGTGKTLIAEVKEFPDAGNYTCLRADTHEIISYEFFLITKVDSNGQMIRSMLRSFEGMVIIWCAVSCSALCIGALWGPEGALCRYAWEISPLKQVHLRCFTDSERRITTFVGVYMMQLMSSIGCQGINLGLYRPIGQVDGRND